MTVRSTVVRKNVLGPYDWVVEMVTLHSGGWPFLLAGAGAEVSRGPKQRLPAGISCAVRRANELVSDLVDGMPIVITRCLRAREPVSRRMSQQ